MTGTAKNVDALVNYKLKPLFSSQECCTKMNEQSFKQQFATKEQLSIAWCVCKRDVYSSEVQRN